MDRNGPGGDVRWVHVADRMEADDEKCQFVGDVTTRLMTVTLINE